LPCATPENVTDVWKVPPSRLYSKAPVGLVTVIIPVDTVQVGCVILSVGAVGNGMIFIRAVSLILNLQPDEMLVTYTV
jgi:hypothetical protein